MSGDTTITPEPTEEERQAAAKAVAEKATADALAAGTGTDKDAIIPDVPARPAGVPEKFYDAKTGQVDMEAWGKAHTDLETKFHTDTTEAAKTDEEKAAEKAAADKVAADNAANPVAAAQTEYAEKGELSDATYKALEGQGLDRATVDSYIEGQQGKVAALQSPAFDAAGGEEKYKAVVEWASENLSEVEVNAYNAQVASNDPEVIKMAAEGLVAKFKENSTIDADPLSGDIAMSGTGVFESKAEMTAAMNVPSETIKGKTKYETDAAFRAAVQKKIIASRKAGKNIFV